MAMMKFTVVNGWTLVCEAPPPAFWFVAVVVAVIIPVLRREFPNPAVSATVDPSPPYPRFPPPLWSCVCWLGVLNVRVDGHLVVVQRHVKLATGQAQPGHQVRWRRRKSPALWLG